MTRIAIYGVGLIGGSLALCFKGRPGVTVVGHSNNPASVEKYLRRQVVDEATTSFEQAAAGADVIFVCVPVGSLEAYLRRLSELPLKPGCIVTDVGSTKSSIVAAARSLKWRDGACFIGGHPMAGSERSGVEAASLFLFENAYYVLTPTDGTPEAAYDRLAALLACTRAQIVRMDPEEHDEIVGAVSHLPHMIAAALVNQVCEYSRSNDMYMRLAAGGFRDITRIASSDPLVWRDILINNRQVLLKLLRDWRMQVDRFAEWLENEDGEGVVRAFEQAGEFRGSLPERRKGVITSMYDVYVDIPDHPGVIGQIATLLGSRGINLSNIQIYESRMDVPGILRLSFRTQDAQDSAVAVLKETNYAVRL